MAQFFSGEAPGRKLGSKNAVKVCSYPAPEPIYNNYREPRRGRDLDTTVLSYPLFETIGPKQRFYSQTAEAGRARLYEDGAFTTLSGRALSMNIASGTPPIGDILASVFQPTITLSPLGH